MAAYGLYTHIASNKFRSMLLLAGLFLLIYVLVYAGALLAEVFLHSDRSVDFYLRAAYHDLIAAFPYATGIAALWIVIAYFFHQNMIDAVTGGESVTRQQEPRLYNLLENLCISRGIPMPKLKIMDSPALNAFATGLNRRQYSVTVTTGLLNALNDQEIEAVLGHELTHIRNGDVQLMVIAVIIAGVVGFFGELFFRMFTNLSWNSQRRRLVVLLIFVFLVVLTRQQGFRRRRGYRRHHRGRADPAGLAVVAGGQTGAVAVARIAGRCRIGRTDQEPRRHDLGVAQDREPGELPGATSAVMELCVDNPREGFADLFATHPSVDSRVEALVKFAGGHDPGPLALPEDTADEPDDPKSTANQPPPPVPRGPWSDAGAPAAVLGR